MSACQSPPEQTPLELRFLPLLEGDPLSRTCGDSTLGAGVSADSLGTLGAIRLVVTKPDGEVVYDEAIEDPVPGAGVKFDGIPVGGGYSLSASVCGTADGPASWVGSATGVTVKDRGTTRTQVHMLPVAGFACARVAEEEGTPETAHLFANAWSGDGRTALVAGGVTASPAGVDVPASTAISAYDRGTDSWKKLGDLPGPVALAAQTVASPSPGTPPALLLLGGLPSVTLGAPLAPEVARLGPSAGAEVPVAPAYWLSADGSTRIAEGVPSRYAAGAATIETDAGSVVGIAGGVTYEGGVATVSDQFHVVEFGAAGPVVREPITLRTPRIAPAVIPLPDKRVFIVIGGNVQDGGFSDIDTLRNLIEIVPLAPPVARGVAVSISIPPGTPEGVIALAGPSAWPNVVLTDDNQLVILGGFAVDAPALVDTARVVPVAIRLQIGATTPTAMVLNTPAAWAEPTMATSFARTHPMRIETPTHTVFAGGFGIATTPEKPRQDAIQVDLATGAVGASVDVPYYAIGSRSVGFADGSVIVSGGLVESGAVNQLAVTNFAALRAGRGLPNCVAVDPDEPDAGDQPEDVPALPDTLADVPPPMDMGGEAGEDVPGDVPVGDAPTGDAAVDAVEQ